MEKEVELGKLYVKRLIDGQIKMYVNFSKQFQKVNKNEKNEQAYRNRMIELYGDNAKELCKLSGYNYQMLVDATFSDDVLPPLEIAALLYENSQTTGGLLFGSEVCDKTKSQIKTILSLLTLIKENPNIYKYLLMAKPKVLSFTTGQELVKIYSSFPKNKNDRSQFVLYYNPANPRFVINAGNGIAFENRTLSLEIPLYGLTPITLYRFIKQEVNANTYKPIGFLGTKVFTFREHNNIPDAEIPELKLF